ncbi:hypothetical protein RJT34_16934 [Clitoria ternatea]|uniref:Uncharacterized protein n=1 Tax=Clitoria ternatea TaxID=43366 RepID=A0AAN9PDA3_CLITE
MMHHNLNLIPFCLISFVVVSWTLFSPCHADDLGLEGILGEAKNQKGNSTQMIPLAAARTHRIDPTNDFNYYEGGWDVTNKQYAMSVAYSGYVLFITAALWFIIVAISCIIIACLCCCGCWKNNCRTKYSSKIYAISLIFLSLFLIMTIVGGVFLFTGQDKFHSTTSDMLLVLVARANVVVSIIHKVISNLGAAKNIQVGSFELPDDIKLSIEKVESFSSKIDYIKSQSEQTAQVTAQFLNYVIIGIITIGVLMLILTVVGLLVSILGWKMVVYVLLFLGWILVTCTFILGGIFLIVHNGVADTCVAMDEWLKKPQEHTALSKLLPCMDEAAAKKTLDISKNTSFQMVDLVNLFVTHVANAEKVPPGLHEMYYNQSGPLMPLLCNPFMPNLTERTCAASEIELKAVYTAYQSFLCDTSPSGICMTTGRLTPSLFSNALVAANLSDTLHRHGPFLASLVDCTFVKETFAQINREHCPPLKRYSNQVYIGLVLVSVAVMFSVILWLVFVTERSLQISSKMLETTHVDVH